MDDLKAFVDEIGKDRIPAKTDHADSRGKAKEGPALDDLLARMEPETFHDPVDFGPPAGKEAL